MWSSIWFVATARVGFWTGTWPTRHCRLGQKVVCNFNSGKTKVVLFHWSNNSRAIWMKIDGSVLEKKSYFEILGLSSLQIWKLDRGPYIASIAKTASKKIGALICSIKFIFLEVAFYIYKYTMQPCMEYCWHIWAGVPTWYLVMLDKLQKRVCRTVGPTLAACHELRVIVKIFSLGITLVDVHLNLIPYSPGWSAHYSGGWSFCHRS